MLGYGEWRARHHAELWFGMHDHAGRTAQRLWVDVTDARMSLHDAAGVLLAEAVLEPPQGLPRWTAPAGAVDCLGTNGEAWQRCFEAQSRWFAQWVPRAAHAAVSIGPCRIERLPVQRRSHDDWWWWWVPLPHVGGTPMAHHTLELHLDSARCGPATAP